MTLAGNLSNAQLAVDYVQTKLTVGAGNKIGDVLASFGGSFLCVSAIRSVEIAVPNSPFPTWLYRSAMNVQHVGCGNCGEQAALAFMHLYDTLHAHPLDYMIRTNCDHAFVVVGRLKGSIIKDYKTWGPEAVVCDPWDGKAFAVSEIPTKAYGAKPFAAKSLFRLE